MRVLRKICCCFFDQEKEVKVNEKTRILPQEEGKPFTKFEKDFSLYVYGVISPSLHRKKLPMNLVGKSVKKLVCGSQHLLILTENGHLLAAGNNEYGQCAYNPESSEDSKLRVIRLESFEVLDIAAGSSHSLFLTKNLITGKTKILGCGHEIGCGFLDRNHEFTPTQIEHPKGVKIKKIFAGYEKSGLLTEENQIFLWGKWNQANKVRKMQELKSNTLKNKKIKKICFGNFFGIILTEKGEVYIWGDNTYGEIGLGSQIKEVRHPLEHPAYKEKYIVDIAAGARHALVMEENGNIYSVGDNSEGECSLSFHRSYTPKEINTNSLVGKNTRMISIWAGEAHSAGLTSDGELYAWGDNSANRIGVKNKLNVKKPMIIEELIGRTVCKVALGGEITVVLVGPHENSLCGYVENLIDEDSNFLHLMEKNEEEEKYESNNIFYSLPVEV